MLTNKRLKELLRYDPRSGAFYWRKTGQTPRGVRSDLIGKRAGCLTRKGYWKIRLDYRAYFGHQLAWLYVYGYIPKELDHKNGQRACCRIANLREAKGRNQLNRGKQQNNSSSYKGVFANGRNWMARIGYKGKLIYLGTYSTPKDAHMAYCKAGRKLHGKFFNDGANQ